MSKPVKWILILGAALILLIIGVIVVVPLVVDVNHYKPEIEALASKQIGRPLTLGGEIKPSVFPWIGVGLQDIHLGNPPAFAEKDFVAIDDLEVRVKLLPILSGRYEIKRFVVKGARIALIKSKAGRLNIQDLGPPRQTTPKAQAPAPQKPQGEPGLPVQGLQADEIALKDCSITWIDHAAGLRKEIKDINLVLGNVSLQEPIRLDFEAVADGHPIALQGFVGPLGTKPGKDALDMDLTAHLLETLAIRLKGRVEKPAQAPRFDLALDMAPFSPRDLLAKLNQPLPFEPADGAVLQKAALQFNLSGTADKVSVTKGRLLLDDTKVTFNAQAKDLSKPDLALAASLDQLDLDRYLPPPSEEHTPAGGQAPSEKPAAKTDYAPLRKLVLDARLTAGELKVKNSRMQNIEIKATARNGILRLDPLGMDLYQGKLAVTGQMDVRGNDPRTNLGLNLGGVQAGTLLKDVLKKEIVQGAMNADITLQFIGDRIDLIRKTLDGEGTLKFNDGAIVGIDLANMVRNAQAAFGMAEKSDQKPRTDFSELMVPFALTKGLAKIDGSKLNSPLLRVLADGSADLGQETLDLRVTPKFVATLVGQGDDRQRSGVMVPVLVKGTFSKPKFAPDLKGLLGQPIPGKEKVTKEIEQTKEKVTQEIEKKAQELFKGLPFGPKK